MVTQLEAQRRVAQHFLKRLTNAAETDDPLQLTQDWHQIQMAQGYVRTYAYQNYEWGMMCVNFARAAQIIPFQLLEDYAAWVAVALESARRFGQKEYELLRIQIRVLLALGDLTNAQDACQQALALSRQLNDTQSEHEQIDYQAIILMEQDQVYEALRILPQDGWEILDDEALIRRYSILGQGYLASEQIDPFLGISERVFRLVETNRLLSIHVRLKFVDLLFSFDEWTRGFSVLQQIPLLPAEEQLYQWHLALAELGIQHILESDSVSNQIAAMHYMSRILRAGKTAEYLGQALLFLQEAMDLASQHQLSHFSKPLQADLDTLCLQIQPLQTEIRTIFEQFCQTALTDIRESLVQQHQDKLLTFLAEDVIRTLLASCDDEQTAEWYDSQRYILVVCSMNGIEATFAEERRWNAFYSQFELPEVAQQVEQAAQDLVTKLVETTELLALKKLIYENRKILLRPEIHLFFNRMINSARLIENASQDRIEWLKSRQLILLKFQQCGIPRGFIYTKAISAEDVERSTIRQFAFRLTAMHYLRRLYGLVEMYKRGGQETLAALADFEKEWPQIQTSQAWTVAHYTQDRDIAVLCLSFPNAGSHILQIRQSPKDFLRWMEDGLRAAQFLDDAESIAAMTGTIGAAHAKLGNFLTSIPYFEQAIKISHDLGDLNAEAIWRSNLGTVYIFLDEYDKAETYLNLALAINQKTSNELNLATVNGSLGTLYFRRGQLERALPLLNEAISMFEDRGNYYELSEVLGSRGAIYLSWEDYPKAQADYDRALEIARQIKSYEGEELNLSNLANLYLKQNRYELARDYHQQAYDIAHERGFKQREAAQLANLASAYWQLNRREQAFDFIQQSLTMAREIHDQTNLAATLVTLGGFYRQARHPEEALRCLTEALSIQQTLPDQAASRKTSQILAEVHKDLRSPQTEDFFQRVLRQAQQANDIQGMISAHRQLGEIKIGVSQYNAALQHFQEAWKLVQNSQFKQDAGLTLGCLGAAYDYLGLFDQALEYYLKALPIVQEHGPEHETQKLLYNVGQAYAKLNNVRVAHDYYHHGLRMAQQRHDLEGEGVFVASLGMLYERERNFEQACQHYRRAHKIYQDLGDQISATRLHQMTLNLEQKTGKRCFKEQLN